MSRRILVAYNILQIEEKCKNIAKEKQKEKNGAVSGYRTKTGCIHLSTNKHPTLSYRYMFFHGTAPGEPVNSIEILLITL